MQRSSAVLQDNGAGRRMSGEWPPIRNKFIIEQYGGCHLTFITVLINRTEVWQKVEQRQKFNEWSGDTLRKGEWKELAKTEIGLNLLCCRSAAA